MKTNIDTILQLANTDPKIAENNAYYREKLLVIRASKIIMYLEGAIVGLPYRQRKLFAKRIALAENLVLMISSSSGSCFAKYTRLSRFSLQHLLRSASPFRSGAALRKKGLFVREKVTGAAFLEDHLMNLHADIKKLTERTELRA